MKIQIFRVAGRSMEPEFREGDFVVISKLPLTLKYMRPGKRIAFVHSKYGMLIKKVQEYNPVLKLLWATGINRLSSHCDEIGPIPVKNVIGEVIGHIRKTHN